MLRIILAATVAFTSIPAYAGGSMSREVSIIYVKPTREVRRQNEINSFRKEMRRQDREERKFQQQLIRDQIREDARRAREADKAYYKKLADQRKARSK